MQACLLQRAMLRVMVGAGRGGGAKYRARRRAAPRIDPERLARYRNDLAQAQTMRRQGGEALRRLEKAKRLTPKQTRTHRIVLKRSYSAPDSPGRGMFVGSL
jgi:hypothetical protein